MENAKLLMLSKEFEEVVSTIGDDPAVLVSPKGERYVLMPAAEFRRLKAAAGEPIPSEARDRRPVLIVNTENGRDVYDIIDGRRVLRTERLSDDSEEAK